MKPNNWTTEPVTVGNTNRDGTGQLYKVLEVTDDAGQYVGCIEARSLGANVKTEGVLLGARVSGSESARDYFMLGSETLKETTAGDASKPALFVINETFPKGFVIYALVHLNQAAGRQFVAKG